MQLNQNFISFAFAIAIAAVYISKNETNRRRKTFACKSEIDIKTLYNHQFAITYAAKHRRHTHTQCVRVNKSRFEDGTIVFFYNFIFVFLGNWKGKAQYAHTLYNWYK